MGTLGSLLDLSRSALSADQNALSVVSNNVANQNTPGYTRETVSFVSGDQVTLSGAQAGYGVSSSAVSQRNRILEQRVQLQTQASSFSSARQTALQQVEGLFGLTASSGSAAATTIGSAIDGLFSSFSALAAAPTDTAVRQAVLASAGTLVQAFNSTANGIAQISAGLSAQATDLTAQINGLTKTIADLNGKIGSAGPNTDAGPLEDQRQLAVAQLSQYVGLDQISAGGNQLTLTLTNGTLLVSGTTTQALSTVDTGGQTQVFSGTGASAQNVTGTITGGQLGGILQVRDGEIPSVISSLDLLANSVGSSVNAVNAAGLDGNGAAGGALFNLPTTVTGSAAGITVATSDPQKVAAGATGQGTNSNANASALAALATTNIVAFGSTASDYFAAVLSSVGTAVASATNDASTQTAALTQVTSERDALSAVSLDQEAANLTQYQRSYQAASKVFSIVDQLYASAINLGTPTTVS